MPEAHHKILQAGIRLRMVGTSTTDETLTHELETNHNIAANNIRAVKSLFPGKTGPLAALRRAAGQARKRHLNLTFEGFGDSRLLVAAEHARWLEAMHRCKEAYDAEAARFIVDYDQHLVAEREAKNGTFNLEDYPLKEKLPEEFAFVVSLLPLPEPNQFLRLALGEELRERYMAQADSAVQTIRRDTFRTLLGLISQTAESLAGEGPIVDSENKRGPLAKLREYLDRVPLLNLTGDPEIAALHAAARRQLDVSTEALRASRTIRDQTAGRAAGIVKQFGGAGARKLAV